MSLLDKEDRQVIMDWGAVFLLMAIALFSASVVIGFVLGLALRIFTTVGGV